MSQIPEQFICPITLDIMKEPVICEDGNTYEKKAIMALKKPISPLTGQYINLKNLISNRVLKELIEQYLINNEKKTDCHNNNTSNFNEFESYNDIYDDFYDEQTQKLIGDLIFEYNNQKTNSNSNSHIKKNQSNFVCDDDIVKDIKIILNNLKININSSQIKNFIEKYLDNYIKVYMESMMNQDIKLLESLYNQNNPIHKYFYLFAIINKLPNVINWLKEKDCIIPNESINLAVMLGDKNLVLWLLTNKCNWNIYTFSYSLESKSIEFINWLKNKNCFWGCLHSIHEYIIEDNPIIKEWLKKNNCPWVLK